MGIGFPDNKADGLPDDVSSLVPGEQRQPRYTAADSASKSSVQTEQTLVMFRFMPLTIKPTIEGRRVPQVTERAHFPCHEWGRVMIDEAAGDEERCVGDGDARG